MKTYSKTRFWRSGAWLAAFLFIAGYWPCVAQEPTGTDTIASDDLELRLAPEMDSASTLPLNAMMDLQADYRKYPYLRHNANRIILNGASWQHLQAAFSRAIQGEGVFSVVHIGDSHIQADGATAVVRAGLQKIAGNAGRGLMVPFKIAGTNQPIDYKITLDAPSVSAKLMRMPWPTQMGFTGVGVHPQLSRFSFTVDAPEPFCSLRIYAKGNFEVDKVLACGEPMEFTSCQLENGCALQLPQAVRRVTITIKGQDVTVFGFDARISSGEDETGVLYHAIGNNGATYSMYTLAGGLGRNLAALEPDLTIISLGANEAFGKVSDATFYNQIRTLINEIRQHNPETQILLTTPAECYRSVYTYTRRRRGKRRRRRRVRTYVVNANVARLRNVLLEYGRDNNIPVYDFYEAAGGKSSAARWLHDGLLSKDRIHRTWAGYRLEGRMLLDALEYSLEKEKP